MYTLAFILQQQSQPGGAASFLASPLVMMLLLFGVFYFLLIRPQQRRQRDLQEVIANLKAGDRIVTTGGIIATITAVRERSLLVRSADKTIFEISRTAVASPYADEEKGS